MIKQHFSRFYFLIGLLIGILFTTTVYSQQPANNGRFTKIQSQLDSLAREMPALNDSVNVSVTDVTIDEFVRAVAMANKVNISIDPNIHAVIVNNFSNASVKNVLLFLIKTYNLDIDIIGNIISIKPYVAPPFVAPLPPAKQLKIELNDTLLSLDLQNDTLCVVAKKITQLSGQNIVVPNNIQYRPVSVFVSRLSVKQAINKICLANQLIPETQADGTILITAIEPTPQQNNSYNSSSNGQSYQRYDNMQKSATPDFILETQINTGNDISIKAENASLDSIVKLLAKALSINYVKLSKIEGKVTCTIQNAGFESALTTLFKGTSYSYKLDNRIYLIGDQKSIELKDTRVIPLLFRPVPEISKNIPSHLKDGLEVIEFAELNSVIVSGPPQKVSDFERYIKEIDKTVPVILIEVMIVESQKTRKTETGLKAYTKSSSISTTGTINTTGSPTSTSTTSTTTSTSSTSTTSGIFPDMDVNVPVDGNVLTKLFNSITGFGWFKLGKVNQDFYLGLKALEDNGIVKIKSTPKLSTLNSHEATLTNGETDYYSENQNSVISNQSIYQNQTKTWKAMTADLKITIKPIVSGDSQITLEIELSTSDFKYAASSTSNAPRPTYNRSFKSIIRVRDQEMVLLGGLDKIKTNKSGTGVPILSRIPILKWIFSYRLDQKEQTKLNIFIKPSIIN